MIGFFRKEGFTANLYPLVGDSLVPGELCLEAIVKKLEDSRIDSVFDFLEMYLLNPWELHFSSSSRAHGRVGDCGGRCVFWVLGGGGRARFRVETLLAQSGRGLGLVSLPIRR